MTPADNEAPFYAEITPSEAEIIAKLAMPRINLRDADGKLQYVRTEPRRPVIGDRVLYVLADGQHRPATVVNAFGGLRANLTVHLDGMNDLYPRFVRFAGVDTLNPDAGRCKLNLVPSGSSNALVGVLSVGSADYDETGEAPGTWNYGVSK